MVVQKFAKQCFTSDRGFYVVTSYQQWTPSPFPQTSDGITQMVGQLDINKEKTAQTALKSDKRRVRNDQEERPRGRPRKPVLPSEMARRQKAANGRERKRMLELTRLFNELKQCLPTNVLVKSKKEILIQV